MATLQDYKIVRIDEDSVSRGITRLNQEADNGYYVVDKLADDSENGITTFLLSQFQPVSEKRDPDTNNVHLNVTDNTATEDFIIVDVSDTSSYPHAFDSFLDVESINLYVDATSNATFELQLGFLENVDGTDGTFFEIMKIASTNQTGVEREIDSMFAGSGGQLRSQDWLSSNQNTTGDFANTVQLASTIDPDTPNVNPDDGDFVMRINRENTDNVSFFLTIVYKSN